jgi:molybdopterin-guanine dinucleotide biosynthesis protein B
MCVPIVAIVGVSGAGKTTLIETLVPELRGRGHRVGTLKHDAHDFEIDRPGKDSFMQVA